MSKKKKPKRRGIHHMVKKHKHKILSGLVAGIAWLLPSPLTKK